MEKERSSADGVATGDYVTAEGSNVNKVVCGEPLASSSTASVASVDKPPSKLEITTSTSTGSSEMKKQEDKLSSLPPLPRPSPRKEMYDKLFIRPTSSPLYNNATITQAQPYPAIVKRRSP